MESKVLSVAEIISLMEFKPTTEEKALIEKAFLLAEKAHDGQLRNSGEPYFNHAVEVAKNCARLGTDTATICGALLHDVLEDTDVPEEIIKNEFGEEILFLVEGVTKLGKLKYHGVERHVESMRKFFMALAEDTRVLIIKLADRLHNVETLSHVPVEKQHRIALETIEVHAALAGRLGMGKLKGLLEDYAFPYAFPNEYRETKALMDELVPGAQQFMEVIKKEIIETLAEFDVECAVQARVKHTYSLYKKLSKYEMDSSKIHDIVALRVLVTSIPDCYQVLGLIHMLWKPLPGRIKDWIAIPKTNGYRSLHTTVLTPHGVFEVQIRTHEMDDEAELGVASHLLYKENTVGKKLSNKQQMVWLSQLKELSTLVANSNDMKDLRLDLFEDRIFVFTPKGDVVDLAEGSCPIDFAYAIHSDIGDKLASAKVNGKMSSLGATLKNGDIVEVTTNKHSHPNVKWLEHVRSSMAKKRINVYLHENAQN